MTKIAFCKTLSIVFVDILIRTVVMAEIVERPERPYGGGPLYTRYNSKIRTDTKVRKIEKL